MRMVSAAFLLLALVLPISATPASAALELNEILAGPARDWDGSGAFSSRDDEWVEVRNSGAAPIDLTGFLITDGDSLPRIALSGTLGPGAHRVVYGRESYEWEQANGFPAFGLSLGNSGDSVLLWQIVGPETLLVDAYTYRSHEAAADRASGRSPDGGAWAVFDGLNPYTGSTPPAGNGCVPTPGAINLCDSTPNLARTWGQVKTRYR